mmetsp:Transcript_9243/g.8867  ORF Transcript_9243/g.8867 Transcript_9243/m.8867 type:complete len:96 (+) Transcript_9243:235-522(+)
MRDLRLEEVYWIQFCTCFPFSNKVHYCGRDGKNGVGKNKNGGKSVELFVPIPPGTLVRDLPMQKLAGELQHDGDTLLISRGGCGGRGNAAFLTPH